MIEIVLYTKAGCGLCDDVKREIKKLLAPQTSSSHLTEIDITSDPDLFTKYQFSIPVLQIGATVLHAPISHDEIIAALRALS